MRKYICWPHDGKHDQPVLRLKQLGQGSCSLNKSKNKTNIFKKSIIKLKFLFDIPTTL